MRGAFVQSSDLEEGKHDGTASNHSKVVTDRVHYGVYTSLPIDNITHTLVNPQVYV